LRLAPVVVVNVRPGFVLTPPAAGAGGPLLRVFGLPLLEFRLPLLLRVVRLTLSAAELRLALPAAEVRLTLSEIRLALSEVRLATSAEFRLPLSAVLGLPVPEVGLAVAVVGLPLHWVRRALHRRLAVRPRLATHDAPTHPLGQVGRLQSLRARPETQRHAQFIKN
jgi:hypothetical protein